MIEALHGGDVERALSAFLAVSSSAPPPPVNGALAAAARVPESALALARFLRSRHRGISSARTTLLRLLLAAWRQHVVGSALLCMYGTFG